MGLRRAAFLAVRLVLLITASQLLTLTTSAISLTDGMESLMRPLKMCIRERSSSDRRR